MNWSLEPTQNYERTRSRIMTTPEQIYEIYKQLSPENKVKAINKYYELLAEQERSGETPTAE